MTRREMLEDIADLGGQIENNNFLDAFCHGCELAPKSHFQDCPAWGDPGCRLCIRHEAMDRILEILGNARDDIVDVMEDAGCGV